jgi:hypothetical protein
MINAIGCPHFYPYFGHFWPKAGTPWGHWEKPKAAVGRTAIQKGHIFVCKAKAYGNLPNFSWHSGIGHKKKTPFFSGSNLWLNALLRQI